MILWTIQSELAYNILMKDGVLTTDERYSEEDFFHAYDWLCTQLHKKIGRGKSKYPLWAWKQWCFERPRPDLRAIRHTYFSNGEIGYRLEIEIPDDQVVLSDFHTWHDVLNKSALCFSETDWDIFENKPYQSHKDEIESTWERVFDLTGGDPEWLGPLEDRRIQANFWELKIENVKKVDKFISVNRSF